jgi:hypothetical protein
MDKQAGREFDAEIASLLGLKVLGFADAYTYEDPDDWLISPIEGTEPVYLKECRCAEIEAYDKELGWQDETKIFGHFTNCLEVVQEYSTRDATALELLRHPRLGVSYISLDFDSVLWYCEIGGDIKASGSSSLHNPSLSLAICRTVYNALNPA